MESLENLTNNISELCDIIKLQRNGLVGEFDCGDEVLNSFIKYESMYYHKALLTVSYVVLNKEDNNDVIAYFSLANDSISINDFDNKTEFNRFRKKRFVNEKRLTNYPAAKICRLGVDLKVKGQSVGTFLLDFIKSYFLEDNKAGCRFLTVDAYSESVPFYLKNGFVPISSEDEECRTRLLYFDLNEIADD